MKKSILTKDMYKACILVLRRLGGKATNAMLEEAVAEEMQLTKEQLAKPHSNPRYSQYGYNLKWTQTNLKKLGILDNPVRGTWILTPKGVELSRQPESIDNDQLYKEMRVIQAKSPPKQKKDVQQDEEADLEDSWKTVLLNELLSLEPPAFERLCQRLLREFQFEEVEVTGGTGDGGIDGKGLLRMNGLLSFDVYFQCKRYRGSVGADAVRDFRGATEGNKDSKNLIITTGSFTKKAKEEAIKPGARKIDLIDGDLLANKMRECQLGIQESVSVDYDWFDQFK
ncbi:MAG: restriction endonuclease [Candidatus Saccharibacteria bacterium]|nr:restriction endonuclease [Candidatus Saccharibacteria bacterium]